MQQRYLTGRVTQLGARLWISTISTISTISGQKHLDLAATHHRQQQNSNKSNTCHLVESQSPSGAQCAVTVTLTLKHTHFKWPLYRCYCLCLYLWKQISWIRTYFSTSCRLPRAGSKLGHYKMFHAACVVLCVAGAVLELVDTKLTEHYTWLVNHLLARACAAPPAAAARRIIVTCSWCSPWPPIISTQRS